ncbi:MAG: nucleotide sugar dehydrogenase [Deltaproteobacteria bacterium]|nr:nucleotide sugar dehydrogenase [Deltaproteobacteria bacterium]
MKVDADQKKSKKKTAVKRPVKDLPLVQKIKSKKARIGVIGMGYVGLPLVIAFCKAGFKVTGFDISKEKVQLLNEGKSYIRHIDLTEFHRDYAESFTATADFSELAKVDCILICVPTPLNKYREPDMTYVFKTARTIAKTLRRGQLIILESTTYPGTTDQDVRAILETKKQKAGEDFYLAFSPEREDPNNKDFTIHTIPKIVGGYTENCLAAADALYKNICDKTVPVSSTRVAESAKLLENIYRAVNIAMVNELKILFDKMDINIWEVIEAAKTKPFGFQAFYPGPGLGGHCIPIDPFYLTWKAREYEFHTKFIELAGEINTSMPDFVVMKCMKALNDWGKQMRGARVLILGLAYKANVDDDRESPSYRLIEKLEELGAVVSYNDPFVPVIKYTREFSKYAGRKSVPISGDYDLFLVATLHDAYKKTNLKSYNIPIVDTRNLLSEYKNHLIHKA